MTPEFWIPQRNVEPAEPSRLNSVQERKVIAGVFAVAIIGILVVLGLVLSAFV